MNKQLISVIMPTFNRASFIKEAIDSVLSQSYDNLELIIIDDYSTDQTEEIIKAYQNQRIKYFKFSSSGVIGALRNFGIKQAKGDLIAFLDSDDSWKPDKLDRQLEYLENNNQVSLIYSPIQVISSEEDTNNRVLNLRSIKSPISGKFFDQLIHFCFIATSTVVLRRYVLERIGYFDEDPKLRCIEDWDLWLRIAKSYRIGFIPQALTLYRMHPHNSTKDGEKFERNLLIFEKQYKLGAISQELRSNLIVNNYIKWAFTIWLDNPNHAQALLDKARNYVADLTLGSRYKLVVFTMLAKYNLIRTLCHKIYHLLRNLRYRIFFALSNS